MSERDEVLARIEQRLESIEGLLRPVAKAAEEFLKMRQTAEAFEKARAIREQLLNEEGG
jgi:C4-type Zn-finger protein